MGTNYMGFQVIKSLIAPQVLTADYAALGSTGIITFPGVNQAFICLTYVAGSEATGLAVYVQYSRDDAGADLFEDPIFSDSGGEYEVNKRIINVPKVKAGKWEIPLAPNGRRWAKVWVKATGVLGVGPGTVGADVEFYNA